MLLKLLQDGFGSAMDLNCAEKILFKITFQKSPEEKEGETGKKGGKKKRNSRNRCRKEEEIKKQGDAVSSSARKEVS